MGNPLYNNVLICCMIAWILAQILKIPIDYWRTQKIHWGLFFSAGGMPSSHSAMMTATTLGIGLFHGFDTSTFRTGGCGFHDRPVRCHRGSTAGRDAGEKDQYDH